MPDTKTRNRGNPNFYASPSDFCQLFSEELSQLFLLAFVLTADQQIAEQCFASALKDCRKANGVFKDWAHAWARRAIIENAIRLLRPVAGDAPGDPQLSSAPVAIPGHHDDARLLAVTALAPFERFVFVMSVLESYSDQECRILLGCFRHEVAEARVRALEHIGRSAQPVASQTEQVARAAVAAAGKTSFVPTQEHLVPSVDSVRLRSIQG